MSTFTDTFSQRKVARLGACVLLVACLTVGVLDCQPLAATPPMGWNSWDAYGLTIDEAQFRANVMQLAALRQYGWQYAVIDEGWYMENPSGSDLASRKYLTDQHGLLIPSTDRFPSATHGRGFKPLADWVHAQGLSIGVHIVRGIPKNVALADLPIASSAYHMMDAADTADGCTWEDSNYGVLDNAAGQAYYDSMFRQFAAWELDFIKVDCISARPYRPTEIRQIATAIRRSGRPMLLDLSPGPAALRDAAELARYAQMWRISDDHWDGWSFPQKLNDGEFPFSLSEAFDRVEQWLPHARPGAWPDEDMLPLGSLMPHPGWGEPRQSRLTWDEQQAEFALWAFARSPLILGCNLTQLDDATRSLLTNRDLITIDQHGVANHPVKHLPPGFEHVRVWEAGAASAQAHSAYFAFFNLENRSVTVRFAWKDLGYRGKGTVRNLASAAEQPVETQMETALRPHGSVLYLLHRE